MKALSLSREEFAAARRGTSDQAIATLEPLVRKALLDISEENWWSVLLAPTRVLFNETLRGDSGGEITADVRAWGALSQALSATLPKTVHKDDATVTSIATYLSTAAINAAAIAAARHDREPLLMQWVTMHDSDVRAAHRHTDGQTRPPGEPFDVDGTPMTMPGDTAAPIELWINCRCMVRPALASEAASLTAASDGPSTGRVVVALPSDSDPVRGVGDEDKHMTLAWLGKPEENPDLDMEAVKNHVASTAAQLSPWTSSVTEVAPLGEDGANVWMCDPNDEGANLARQHVNDGPVHEGTQAVKQHPQFTPHVTIGYSEAPPEAHDVSQVSFDRLGVWDGEDQTEYPLGGSAMTETTTAAISQGDDIGLDQALAWHGVLAPEGVWSGDGRQFAPDSLRFRDLPMPLSWQKMSDDGHNSSYVVAKIEQIARVDGEMRGRGHWLASPEADEAIGLVGEFGKFGVSIDADDSEFDFDEATEKVTFTSARIASACLVPIPAFSEAYVSLGAGPDDFMPVDQGATVAPPGEDDDCDPNSPDYEDCMASKNAGATAGATQVFVSDKPWSDFGQGDYTPEQWKSACVLHLSDALDKSQHKLPIKEPGGALNRNGVHAAAARFNQVDAPAEAKARAKSALRGAYSTLGEEPPDVLAASLVELSALLFKRGPGWLTNPEDTKRIHDYWTVPGEPGYVKVGWGTDGDFNRCRVEIGEEIGENSPEKLRFLNQICAQWHHDATGFWPGHAPAEQGHSLVPQGDPAPALTLVASSSVIQPPGEWFADPEFDALTPLTVTEDGRVFGHLAGWKQCHLSPAFGNTCVAPPRSETAYAYFLTGEVLTTEGPVPVGHITLGGNHAPPGRMGQALAHYDSTSSVVADVMCGDDEHGIWLAGYVRPGVEPEKVVALRASAPSGDWRKIGRAMELILAHSVNTPGFTIARVGVENGEQVSLVAAGMFEVPSADGIDYDVLADRVADKVAARRQRMLELAGHIGGAD